MNTSGLGGKNVTKNISVVTNDKAHTNLKLTISGMVDNFANINPRKVNLNGNIDQKLTATVSIIPEEKFPFKILETKANKGESIGFKLDEIKKEKGVEYILTVENTVKTKGRFFDTIVLRTDSKIQPEIKISVYGNIEDPKEKEQGKP